MQNHAHLQEEPEVLYALSMLQALAADKMHHARRSRDSAELAGDSNDGAMADLANMHVAAHDGASWMLAAIGA